MIATNPRDFSYGNKLIKRSDLIRESGQSTHSTHNVDNFFGKDSNLLDNYFVDNRFPRSNEIVQSKKFQPEYNLNSLNSGSSRIPVPNVPPGLSNYQPGLNSSTMIQKVQANPKDSLHSEESKDVFKHPDQISSDYQFMVELRRFLKHHSTVMNINYNNILPKHFIEYLELVDNMGPLYSKSSTDNYYNNSDCNNSQYFYERITEDTNELIEKNPTDNRLQSNQKTFSSDSKSSNVISNHLERKANDNRVLQSKTNSRETKKLFNSIQSNAKHSKPSTEIFEYNLEEAMLKNKYLVDKEISSDNSNSTDSSDESKVSEIKEDSYIDYSKFSDSICIGISDNRNSVLDRRDVMTKVNIILRYCNLPALGSNVYKCFLIPKRGVSKQWVRPLIYLTFNSNKDAKESFDKISSYISKIKVYIDKPTVKFSNKFIDNNKGRRSNGKK